MPGKRNRARWRPCLILCAGLLALTLFFGWGVLGWPCSPTQPSGASLEAPSAAHWLGTDDLGIDIYAQLSQGFFASMSLGLACGVLTALIGGGLGMLAGYKGGGVQAAVDFAVNVFLAVPQLPVLIVLGAFWGQDRRLVIGLIAAFSWAPVAKQTAAKTRSAAHRTYVRAAKSWGAGSWYIFKNHLAADVLPVVLVGALAVVGKAILQESALAYLGLSDPTAKSWGLMINRASRFAGIYFTDYWKWWLAAPVAALMLTILFTRLLARWLEQQLLEGDA